MQHATIGLHGVPVFGYLLPVDATPKVAGVADWQNFPETWSSLRTLSAMRILVLNPNTSESITARLAASAQKAAAPGTVIIPLTAPRGVPYIATRAEAQIGGAIAGNAC
jgi:Hydantoin racemase